MRNPLCKYEKFIDAIDFLKNNLTIRTDKILVPFAETCYFYSPIFYKFDFDLNFIDDAAFYFWKIFKEDRFIFDEMIHVFDKYGLQEDTSFIQTMMHQETRPAYKALLFLMLSDKDYKSNFKYSNSLPMGRVSLSRNRAPDYSKFVLHSHIDKPFLNDDRVVEEINKFQSKIVIANNAAICEFINFDNKFDFSDCFILVSTR